MLHKCRESSQVFYGPLGVGQGRIDATGERADVVAQDGVGAVDHDRNGRQDEHVLRHRLAAQLADHGLTSADVHPRLRERGAQSCVCAKTDVGT